MAEREVRFKIVDEQLKDIERLKDWLHSPNLATALYNAVSLVNTLHDYEKSGFELRLVSKDGVVHRFQLPAE